MRTCILLLMVTMVLSHIEATIVWLYDGKVLHGEIIDYGEVGISLKRYDTEGVIKIPWNRMEPTYAIKLKKKLGLIVKKKSVGKTKGVLIYLKTGGSIKGKLLKKTNKGVVIKNRTGKLPIPRENVIKIIKTVIDIAAVYSSDEIYEQAKKKYDVEKGESQLKLGILLMNAGVFDKAKTHLEKAKELTPELEAKIQPLLQEIEQFSADSAKKKMINRFFLYKRGHQYKKAFDLLEEMKDVISKEKIEQYKNELMERQREFLQKGLASQWLRKVFSQIDKISVNRQESLQDARSAVLKDVETNIAKNLAEQYGISQAEIRSAMQERASKSTHKSSYGSGTFIVGINGRKPEKSHDIEKIPKPKEGGERPVAKDLDTPDEWWKKANSSERRRWLRAFYLENRFNVQKQRLRACALCGATGARKKGKETIVCPRCHGVRYDRTVVVK